MSNLKNISKLTIIKIIASVLGILYSMTQAYFFGASREIEIYYAAHAFIYFVISLTQSGQLSSIFLPEYHKIKTDSDKETALKAFSVVVNKLLVYVSIFILIMLILAPYAINIMVPGYSESDQNSVVLLFQSLSVYILLQLFNSYNAMLLNAERIYGKPEIISAINVLISIVILFIFYRWLKVWAIVLSLYLGKIVEMIFYLKLRKVNNLKHYVIFSVEKFNHKDFFKIMFSTLPYVLATQSFNVVLTSMSSFLNEGIYAVFNYTKNLGEKLKGILVMPTWTVFRTEYSILFQKKQKEEAQKTISLNFNNLLLINLSAFVFLFCCGNYIVDFLWAGSKFGKEMLQLAYLFLLFRYGSIIIIGGGNLFRIIAINQGFAKKYFNGQSIVMSFLVLYIYLAIKFFDYKGLMTYPFISEIALSVVPIIVLLRNTSSKIRYFFTKETHKILLFSTIIFGITFFCRRFFVFSFSGVNNRVSDIINIVIYSIVIFITTFGLSLVIKIDNLEKLKKIFIKKLRR